jgi:PBSX family phage terminase large subunit
MQWGLFSPKGLQSIAESDARLNIWHGAVRSSKTINSIVRWIEFVRTAPPGDLLMLGKTERTLKRNILGILEEILGAKHFRHNQGEGEVWIYGRRCYTAGANDEQAAGKIRGLTLVGAYGDEVVLWPQSVFIELLNRLSIRGAKAFFTTNPDNPFHWLKAQYLDNEKLAGTLKQWHFELDDNPNLDPEYVASLKNEHTGVWYARMILGLWVAAEGAIYDQFDINRNGFTDKETPEAFDSINLACDYGTQNPFAGLLVGRVGDTSWVLRELYYSGRENHRQKTDGEYSKDITAWLGEVKTRRIIVDPSAASFIAQLRKDGFKGLVAADNDVIDGIRLVSTRLGQGKLKIHKTNCPNLVREFASYAWDKKAADRGEDKPLKVNDHCLDALRYEQFTMRRGPITLTNLDIGLPG